MTLGGIAAPCCIISILGASKRPAAVQRTLNPQTKLVIIKITLLIEIIEFIQRYLPIASEALNIHNRHEDKLEFHKQYIAN